jgi:hypothetical protein
MQQLKKVGYHIADMLRYDQVVPLDILLVKDLLDYKSDSVWDGLDICPCVCASPRALFCRYLRWVARPSHAYVCVTTKECA